MSRVHICRENHQASPPSKALRQSAFVRSAANRGLSKHEIVDEARLFPKSVVQQCRMLRLVK